jgi:hypothetical protein
MPTRHVSPIQKVEPHLSDANCQLCMGGSIASHLAPNKVAYRVTLENGRVYHVCAAHLQTSFIRAGK